MLLFPNSWLRVNLVAAGSTVFVEVGKTINMPVDIFFQSWLSQNGKGLGIWPPLVKPAGVDSDILGTVATQGFLVKHLKIEAAPMALKSRSVCGVIVIMH